MGRWRVEYNKESEEMRDKGLAGSWIMDDGIIQYSVYTVLSVWSTQG